MPSRSRHRRHSPTAGQSLLLYGRPNKKAPGKIESLDDNFLVGSLLDVATFYAEIDKKRHSYKGNCYANRARVHLSASVLL